MSAADYGPDDRIAALEIDDADAPAPSPDMENERSVAAFEILEENAFAHARLGGPYAVTIRAETRAVAVEVVGADGAAAASRLEHADLRDGVVDYSAVCDAYRSAVRTLAPSQIEQLDRERRAAHEEGAAALVAALGPDARCDDPTAKRLFTLICALPAAQFGAV